MSTATAPLTPIAALAAAIVGLVKSNAPACCWVESDILGGGQSAHWGGTLDAVREHLGRRLTEAELTALSLSRAYGPTPLLNDNTARSLIDWLFPDGNGRGEWYEWDELARKIIAWTESPATINAYLTGLQVGDTALVPCGFGQCAVRVSRTSRGYECAWIDSYGEEMPGGLKTQPQAFAFIVDKVHW